MIQADMNYIYLNTQGQVTWNEVTSIERIKNYENTYVRLSAVHTGNKFVFDIRILADTTKAKSNKELFASIVRENNNPTGELILLTNSIGMDKAKNNKNPSIFIGTKKANEIIKAQENV